MFRLKVSATLTLIILGMTAAVYFILPSTVEEAENTRTRHSLEVAATSLERTERLDDFAVLAKAEEIAGFSALRDSLVGEYEGNYEYERHLGVYNKGLLRWQYHYKNLETDRKGARNIELPLTQRRPFTPELLFVTDEKGVGVAALGTNKYDWYNKDVAEMQPGLTAVLESGKPSKDIWLWSWGDGQAEDMYHVGIVPVMQGSEKVIGAVVVGTQVGDGVAKAASESVGGHDVAYFAGNRIWGSTLDADTDEALAAQLFGEGSTVATDTTTPPPVEVEVDGKRYLTYVRFYAHNATADGPRSGFVVMTNLDASGSVATKIRAYTIVVGLLTLIMVLGVVFIFLYLFVKPFEQIDQGIQEVLAGNKDYVFNAGGSLQGEMAHSLNLMSAYLQGKRMPDEDEEEGGWSDFMVAEVTQSGVMKAAQISGVANEAALLMNQGLAAPKKGGVSGIPMSMFGGDDSAADSVDSVDSADAGDDGAQLEDRDTYLQRIHAEYVTAKKNIGGDAEGIDFEGFVKRLDKNAERLKVKHNARDIRFSVVVRDGKVVLKPTPIF